MPTVLVIVFVIAYAAIALEHPIRINKSASALLGAGLLWTIYAMSIGDHELVNVQLGESLIELPSVFRLPKGDGFYATSLSCCS